MQENSPGAASAPMMELPRYISCKQVWALKIADITQAPQLQTNPPGGSWLLHFEDFRYAPREVTHDWLVKRGAKVGGYFILYEDGYTSWSPAEAFEKVSTPEAEWGMPRSQETKYRINLRGKLENRHTGKEVNCPVWVLLSQDLRAIPFLQGYREDVPPSDTDTRSSMDVAILQFSDFRHRYPEAMKLGDSKRPMPPVPYSINPHRGEFQPQRWDQGEREQG